MKTNINELTTSEREHLRLLRIGLTVKEAAKFVSRSLSTVESHRQSIREKIGADDYERAWEEGERAREQRNIAAATATAA